MIKAQPDKAIELSAGYCLGGLYGCRSDDFDSAFQLLIDAIDTDLSHVRSHTRLLVRAREWEHKEHDSSFYCRAVI